MIAIVAALIAAGSLTIAGDAEAYSTAPGYVAQDYATGFPASPVNHWGPIGIAFDQSDNLYVGDPVDGNIYRFAPGGGAASVLTRLTLSPIPGTITGLAFTRSGSLYVARYQSGDVVQVDPATGQLLRTVASVPCATGLAVDPASGDLFVSENACGNKIWRISDFASGPGSVSAYTSAPGVDGLAFDRDGTLYAESDGNVLKIAGTQSPAPGVASSIASVPHGDGLAFGAHTSGAAPFLVANRTDGVVTRVDFGPGVPSQTPIFSGGSRGDFSAVDSHGCLYVTQSDSVVRISGSGAGCAFQPTNPAEAPPPPPPGDTGAGSPGPGSPSGSGSASGAGSGSSQGIGLTTLSTTPAPGSRHATATTCTPISSLRFRIARHGGIALRSATVFVNGHKVKTLRGSAVTRPVTISRLPRSPFTLTVTAVTTRGRALTTRQSFAQCRKPKPAPLAACPRGNRLTVTVPQRRGTRIVRVEVYVDGHRVEIVRGYRIRAVALRRPTRRFVLSLVTMTSRRTRARTTRTVSACATAHARGAPPAKTPRRAV